MDRKPVLGKGLASLFPGAIIAPQAPNLSMGTGAAAAGEASTIHQQEVANRDRHPGISMCAPEDLIVNNYQPRRDFDEKAIEELAQSIRSNGIIQPLVVRKTANGYQLIAGERRLRAAKKAGLKQVPIVIRRSTDREALELALIENIQRQDLNCIDEALAYFQLIQDFALTQEEVGTRVGKDRATVANHLRLLRLPEAIIDDLKRQILSFGHGKVLLGVEDNDIRLLVRAKIVEKKLSVRETEAMIEEMKQQAEAKARATGAAQAPLGPVESRLKALAQDLTRQWSTKVEVRGNARRGKIVVHYANQQELDRILNAMQNKTGA